MGVLGVAKKDKEINKGLWKIKNRKKLAIEEDI